MPLKNRVVVVGVPAEVGGSAVDAVVAAAAADLVLVEEALIERQGRVLPGGAVTRKR